MKLYEAMTAPRLMPLLPTIARIDGKRHFAQLGVSLMEEAFPTYSPNLLGI